MFEWQAFKPWLTALALPPVPFLLLILIGARLILPRRGLGYLAVSLGVAGIWMSACQVTAVYLQDAVLRPPAPLLGPQQARLTSVGAAYAQQCALARDMAGVSATGGGSPTPPAAIIALGGGREAMAAEYGSSDLSHYSAERLRYAIWLARSTGLPVGFSGGVGWAQQGERGDTEAATAERIARQFYGVRLRWVEDQSSDTRQNAMKTVQMLASQGVGEIVLVTDAFHMPRALRVFREAARRSAARHPDWPEVKVTPAALQYWRRSGGLDWLPSLAGLVNVRLALKEALGQALGI